MSLLSQRHEVIAIRLADPRETDLPDLGVVVMEDAETGEQLYVDTHDKKFRQKFFDVASTRESVLTSAFQRAGVDVMTLSTQSDLVHSIVRFAKQRQQVRK